MTSGAVGAVEPMAVEMHSGDVPNTPTFTKFALSAFSPSMRMSVAAAVRSKQPLRLPY